MTSSKERNTFGSEQVLLAFSSSVRRIVDRSNCPSLLFAQHIPTKGTALFKQVVHWDMEGIVCKRKLAPYAPDAGGGRSTIGLLLGFIIYSVVGAIAKSKESATVAEDEIIEARRIAEEHLVGARQKPIYRKGVAAAYDKILYNWRPKR